MLVPARRLERNIKDVLDEMGDDRGKLEDLLTGKRVDLSEELSKWIFYLKLRKSKSNAH